MITMQQVLQTPLFVVFAECWKISVQLSRKQFILHIILRVLFHHCKDWLIENRMTDIIITQQMHLNVSNQVWRINCLERQEARGFQESWTSERTPSWQGWEPRWKEGGLLLLCVRVCVSPGERSVMGTARRGLVVNTLDSDLHVSSRQVKAK